MNERLDQIRALREDIAKKLQAPTYTDPKQSGWHHQRFLRVEPLLEDVGCLLEQLQAAQAAVEGLREAVDFYKQPPTASTLLIWCLRYLDAEGLDYIYDKLQRRCPLGKQQAGQLYPAPAPQPPKGGEGV